MGDGSIQEGMLEARIHRLEKFIYEVGCNYGQLLSQCEKLREENARLKKRIPELEAEVAALVSRETEKNV